MVELRALRLVHRHGKHRAGCLQPAGQHPADRPPVIQEHHPQPSSRTGQRDAHIAIHQAQLIIVVRDHHRTPGIPALAGSQ